MPVSQSLPDATGEPSDPSRASPGIDAPWEVLVEAIPRPFLALYPDLTIAKANAALFEKFRLAPENIHGCEFYKDSSFDDFELEYDVPGEGPISLRVIRKCVLTSLAARYEAGGFPCSKAP